GQAQATIARTRIFEETSHPLDVVASIEGQLPGLERRVSVGIEETEQVINARPSLASLDALIEPWADVRLQAKAWVAALTDRAEQLDAALASLDALRARWTATQAAAPAQSVPAATVERIQSTLAIIGSVRGGVADRRSHVLVLQDRAAQELARA